MSDRMSLYNALHGLSDQNFNSAFLGSGEIGDSGRFLGPGLMRPGGNYPNLNFVQPIAARQRLREANAAPEGLGLGSERQAASLGFGGLDSGQGFTLGPVGKQAWGGAVPGSGLPAEAVFEHNGQTYDMTGVDPRYRDASQKAIMLGRTDWLRGAKPIPKPARRPDLTRY